MGDLVTLTEARTHMKLDSSFTADDADISQLITLCSAAVESYARRSFSAVEVVDEYHDGGVEKLVLTKRPVISLDAIIDRADGSTVDPTTYEVNVNSGLVYVLSDNSLIDLDLLRPVTTFAPRWGAGRRRWRTQYHAGFSSVPGDIKLPVLLWIATLRAHPEQVNAESIGDYSVRPEVGLPTALKQIIDNNPLYKATGF